MGVVPIIRDVLGSLNHSHGLANGLRFAARLDAPGKPINLVNPNQGLAVLNYALNSTDPLGPRFKSTANTGNIKLTPTIPVKNGCWTVSTLTMFPVNALDFCVLMANRTANLYHVLKNATTHQLITYDGSARLFSPTIDVVALTGEHRLTVAGHPGGAIAYLDGVKAGSHAFVLNADIEDFLGDPQGGTTNRAWGNSKELHAWNRTLGPDEVLEHHFDSFGMFADDRLAWFLAVLSSGRTLSAAITEANDVFTALVQVAVKISGSVTEANDIFAASAKVAVKLSAAMVEANDSMAGTLSGASRTVSAAITEANDAMAAAVKVAVKLTSNATEANDLLAAILKVAVKLSMAATEANDAMLGIINPPIGGGVIPRLTAIASINRLLTKG